MGRNARLPLHDHNLIANVGNWCLYLRPDRGPTPPYLKLILLAPEGAPKRRYHLDWNEQVRHITGNDNHLAVLRKRHPEMLEWVNGCLQSLAR